MPICLCTGGKDDPSFVIPKLRMTSSRRYAQSTLQNSLAFSLDLNIEVSRFEIAASDILDIGSAFTSRNMAFNGEL
jgi:hypothetical protein